MKTDVHMNLQFKKAMNKSLQRTFAAGLITVSSKFYSTGSPLTTGAIWK